MKGFIDIVKAGRKVVWNKKVENTYTDELRKIIEAKYNVKLENYFDLHEWSVKNYESFWAELWDYFKIIHSKPYETVAKKGDFFLDVEWFSGCRMNYAENLLRHRDDHVALLCLDDEGNEDRVTYAELYEETKQYVAAFRKMNVKQGDRVACYMSNRKEAIFAMLAASSIGAIFGGPTPFFGAKAATDILNIMGPTVLIAVDRMRFNNTEISPMENLPTIVNNVPSLKKVVIVPTKKETLSKDITDIKQSCFLKDFLETGRNADGTFPDITFEQLPFMHPICINFTSGTTGVPKGLVHCAGAMLGSLRDFRFHYNFDRNDVALSLIPVGWGVWFVYNGQLLLGNTILVYDGNPLFLEKPSLQFWDFVAKYKISFLFLETSEVDQLEKQNIVPSSDCNLENLKMIHIFASPVKPQNFEFCYDKIKKDCFSASCYGSTECIGSYAGSDLNLPVYSGEIQAFGLGMDCKCYDENGKPVIGQIGNLVVATPSPTLPIKIWNDSKKRTLQDVYFSEYSDAFNINDKAWIDPDTKGAVILGRSDDVIKQRGERFTSQEIYLAIHDMEEIADYLCVPQANEKGDHRAILFVKLKSSFKFDDKMAQKIKNRIKQNLSIYHVPDLITEAKDIPYNFNGKRLEKLVKTIISDKEIPQHLSVRNPECLPFFLSVPEILSY